MELPYTKRDTLRRLRCLLGLCNGFYVDILQSEKDPARFYTGFTADLKRRLDEHNQGARGYSKEHAPWILSWYCAFRDEHKARQSEAYLKSGSGRAFIDRGSHVKGAVSEPANSRTLALRGSEFTTVAA
jgi:putative endonuclease